MTGVDSWSITPATNATADGGSLDWAEQQLPSTVNDSARQMTADLRSAFNDLAWFQYGTGDQNTSTHLAVPCVYASATSFTITGADVTSAYHANRRVRAVGTVTGTIYGSISSSSYDSGSTITTVNVTWDSGSLSDEDLVISISQVPVTGNPVPTGAVKGGAASGANSDITALLGLTGPIPGSDAPVKSASTTSPPSTPADGDRYIVPTGSSGAWSAQATKLAQWNAAKAAWYFWTPTMGMEIYAQDLGLWLKFNGSAWILSNKLLFTTNLSSLQSLIASGITVSDGTTVFVDGDAYFYDSTYTGSAVPATPGTFQSWVIADNAGRKWREMDSGIINGLRWGMIGDGTDAGGGTDNLGAINNALAATYRLAPNGTALSTRLRIPAGSYRYTSKLTIQNASTNNVLSLAGDGRNSSVLLADFQNDDAVLITGNVIELRGLGINGTTSRSSGTSGNGIQCTGSITTTTQSTINLIDVNVQGHKGNGIDALDPESHYYRDVFSQSNGGEGIYWHTVTPRGINNLIVNCRSTNNQKHGFYTTGGIAQSTLIDLQSLSNCQGGATTEEVYVNGYGFTLINPDIENTVSVPNTTSGLRLAGGVHTVINPFTYSLGQYGIWLTSCNDSRITNPTIKGNSSSNKTSVGVYMQTSTGNIVEIGQTNGVSNVTTIYNYDATTAAANTVSVSGVQMQLDYKPAFAASYTPDLSKGLFHKFTQSSSNNITGNLTVNAPTNLPTGLRDGELAFEFQQDATTGGFTITWNSIFVTAYSNTGNTTNKRCRIAFRYSSEETKWIQTYFSGWM